MTAECNGEDTNIQAVNSGIFVLIFQMSQPDLCIRVTDNTANHLIDDRFGASRVDTFAQTYIFIHVMDNLSGLVMNFVCLTYLLLKRYPYLVFCGSCFTR